MNDGQLPPPFIVGQKYFDRNGEYTVTATDGHRITAERADGRRTVEDVATKAQIHRNIMMDRRAALGSDSVSGGTRRRERHEPTGRRRELMAKILQFEADGAEHSGVEVDGLLASLARDLGYSEEEVSRLNPNTGRSLFANDGDWAKAEMTEERFHEVVGTTVYWNGGVRRQCNVYRITARGLDELRKRR